MKQTMLPFAYLRKKIIPFNEATIHVASQSLQYGTICFGGIRGYFSNGKPGVFRLKDHFQRLNNASKILGMNVQLSWNDFHDLIGQLIQKNVPQTDFYIRPFLFTEDQDLGPRFDGHHFDLGIYMFLLHDYFDTTKGLRLMFSSWRKFSDTMMTTKAKAGGCYINSALAKTEARQNGYDEALLMDDQGNVVEASVANLFIVYKGEIMTPEAGSAMLEGITRRTVIDFLAEENIPVKEARIDRSMVYTSEELILTGTAAQVMYGQSVDGRIISAQNMPGPICQMLKEKFNQVIQGKHPKSKEWMFEY